MKEKIAFKACDAVLKFVGKNISRRPYVSAVVAAAGSSSRMNGIDKMFAEIDGTPVLAITLSALNASKYIDEIVIVTREENIPKIADLCKAFGFEKVTNIVKGGDTRQCSVYAGLKNVSDKAEIIAIHDGARPFVSEEIIKEAVLAAGKYGAAAPAVPVKDTVKVSDGGFAVSTPDRSTLFAVQTPQCFDSGLIKAAIYAAIENNETLTDDCSAVEAAGGKIRLTEGSYENIKITTPEDLIFGEAIFSKEK